MSVKIQRLFMFWTAKRGFVSGSSVVLAVAAGTQLCSRDWQPEKKSAISLFWTQKVVVYFKIKINDFLTLILINLLW